MSARAPVLRPTLQPQDLILTILGVHLRGPHAQVWSGGTVELLGELGFSTEAARAALARLAARSLLTRHKEGRLVFYALTARAEQLLSDGDRRIYSFGRGTQAGNDWTMLWHAIPESHRVARSRLASRLRFLGFGSVQDGTWIAAHNRERETGSVLRTLEIEQFASVFVGQLSQHAPPTALIDQAWDIAAVADMYSTFILKYGPLLEANKFNALSAREAFATHTVLIHNFRQFPATDPELPEAIDSLHAARAETLAIFDAVRVGLADIAETHFRQMARPR